MKLVMIWIIDFLVLWAASMTGYVAYGFWGGVAAMVVAMGYGVISYVQGLEA